MKLGKLLYDNCEYLRFDAAPRIPDFLLRETIDQEIKNSLTHNNLYFDCLSGPLINRSKVIKAQIDNHAKTRRMSNQRPLDKS